MLEEKQFKKIMDKLNSLTIAFAIQTIKDVEDRNEKMWLLHAMGLSNSEIAKILNTTKGTVKVTLSKMRVEKSKKKGEDDE